jgi:hypothetical protein
MYIFNSSGSFSFARFFSQSIPSVLRLWPFSREVRLMPRIARFVRTDIPTVYHVISRTALPGFPLEDAEKDYLLDLILRLSSFYFVDVLGFCVMSNHFHLVVRMHPSDHLSDDAMRERLEKWFPERRQISDDKGTWGQVVCS